MMPYTKRTLPTGRVQVSSPSGVKSRGSTPANARRQVNLLRAIDRGWKPTGRNAMAKRMRD